jgi:hypothetical protein
VINLLAGDEADDSNLFYLANNLLEKFR